MNGSIQGTEAAEGGGSSPAAPDRFYSALAAATLPSIVLLVSEHVIASDRDRV